MTTNKSKMIKTDAGDFLEMRLSIRMPKPMWRALGFVAHAMQVNATPVRCATFGDGEPSIAAVIRALVMESTAEQLRTIGPDGPEFGDLSVRELVATYIAAGYGQNSAVPAVVDGRDDPKPATDGHSDADRSENAVKRD